MNGSKPYWLGDGRAPHEADARVNRSCRLPHLHLLPWERFPRKISRIKPLNRSRRRESALILCLESRQVRRLTSAPTRFRGRGRTVPRLRTYPMAPAITRVALSCSLSLGRVGVRG